MLGAVQTLFDFVTQKPYLIAAGIFVYSLIYLLSWLFSGPKRGKNPFSINNVGSPAKLETDQRLRDKVLKQKFKPEKVPENLDAIIIGSGMGGMSAGVLLSRAGKRVLVLEQHDQAGGCCHTFHDKGFEFDTGVHYIGQMDRSCNLRVLIDQLTGGKVEFPEADPEFDVVTVGASDNVRWYPMSAGKEAFKQAIIDKFPEEKEAIEKFIKLMLDADGLGRGYFMLKIIPKWLASFLTLTGIFSLLYKSYWKYMTTSLKSVLDELTDNSELKAVLSYAYGDYGSLPSNTNLFMHSFIINHFIDGAYYIRGGPSEVVLHMIPIIEQHGGKVLVQARVSQILTDEKGRANGVQVFLGGDTVDIFADTIISNAGICNTFLKLLPKTIASKSCIYPSIKKIGSSLSFVTLFVGLKGDRDELQLKAQNIWAFSNNDVDGTCRKYVRLTVEEALETPSPLLFISFPSAKDPTFKERNPGKSTCLVIASASYHWFSKWENSRVKRRGDDYEGLKMALGRHIWNQTVDILPHLADKVEYFDVGSPVSNKYYLGYEHGEMYGLSHKIARFAPDVTINFRSETDIPGLHLTGQDVTHCGLAGAMYGGMVCGSSVLHRNLFNDLDGLMKKIKKDE